MTVELYPKGFDSYSCDFGVYSREAESHSARCGKPAIGEVKDREGAEPFHFCKDHKKVVLREK